MAKSPKTKMSDKDQDLEIKPIPFNDALKRVWSAPHKPKKKAVKKKSRDKS